MKQDYDARREGWPDITDKNYKDYFKWLQQKVEAEYEAMQRTKALRRKKEDRDGS